MQHSQVAVAAASSNGVADLTRWLQSDAIAIYSMKGLRAIRTHKESGCVDSFLGWKSQPSADGRGIARFSDGCWLSDVPFATLRAKAKATLSHKAPAFRKRLDMFLDGGPNYFVDRVG